MRKLFVLFAAATMIAPAFAIEPATTTVSVQVDAFSYVAITPPNATIQLNHTDKQSGVAQGVVTSGSNNGSGYKVVLSLTNTPTGITLVEPSSYLGATYNCITAMWDDFGGWFDSRTMSNGPFNDVAGKNYDVWAKLGTNWIDAAAGTTGVTVTATLIAF